MGLFMFLHENQSNPICIIYNILFSTQLHSRCSYMTKHKRNCTVAGGVIASVFISPVLAALAVGRLRQLCLFFTAKFALLQIY
jgi:hypothetical protein